MFMQEPKPILNVNFFLEDLILLLEQIETNKEKDFVDVNGNIVKDKRLDLAKDYAYKKGFFVLINDEGMLKARVTDIGYHFFPNLSSIIAENICNKYLKYRRLN